MKALKILFLLLCLVVTLGCEKEKPSENKECKDCLTDIVIVKNHGNYDACGWVFYPQKGNGFLKPNELSQEYKKEGEKFKIFYKIVEENYSCGFDGGATLVKIIKIEKISK